MKKFALALALSAAAVGSAQAEGFNLGVALGYGNSSTNAKLSAGGDTRQYGHKGIVGGVFAGYRMMVSEGDMPFIVGVELAGDLSGLKAEDKSQTIKFTQKYSLQGVITLGTKLGGAMTDLRLGYSYGSFEVKNTATPGDKVSKKKGGFLVGLGVSGKISEAMTLGLTYDHTFFSKIKYGTLTNYGSAVEERPRTGVAKLRLAYSF